VLEVEHIRTGTTITVDEVEIGLQLETRGKQHCDEVLRTLRGKGYHLKFG
jgi:threonine dehydratase